MGLCYVASVRIIALSTLKAFLNRSPAYADAQEPVMAWHRQVMGADWATPADVNVRSAAQASSRTAEWCLTSLAINIASWCGSIIPIGWSTSGSLGHTASTTQSMHRPFEG